MRNRKLSKSHLEIVLARLNSNEHKAKVRKANLGRKNSVQMKEKMKNLVRTEEVRAKLSKNLTNYNLSKAHKIEITNVEEKTNIVFESINKAAIWFNTNHNTLRNYIKNGKLYKGVYKITRVN